MISLTISSEKANSILLFSQDLKGIAVSGGSACRSGAIKSHVTEALGILPENGILRISLNRFNTKEELQVLIDVLEELFKS